MWFSQFVPVILFDVEYHSESEHAWDGRTKYLTIVCAIIRDDGQKFGFARRVLEIDEYRGTRPIANLPVYSLQYHDDNYGIYSRFVQLGNRYLFVFSLQSPPTLS